MALPSLNLWSKKREQILSIDLGGRTTKAVQIEKEPAGYVLSRFAILDAPIVEKSPTPELLGEHLRSVCKALDSKTRFVVVAISVNDVVIRPAELPPMSLSDMRQILKNNSKNILQQDLPGHVFDLMVLPPKARPGAEKPKAGPGGNKQRVLVAATKSKLLDEMQAAMKNAGLTADIIFPGALAPANAFELAMPEVFSKEVVALVDIGFKQSSIVLLEQGEVVLSRVVTIGGDKLTSGLAESMGISYAEAEGIKVGLPAEVQATLEALLQPLGRELRASIDFFEHQNDKPVNKVFVTGGSSQSEFIVQTLQTELMLDCKAWNPVGSLQLALPPQQTVEIEQTAAQLTVAIGAALAAF
jgi:type IV pilus assembly protein PilM